MLLHKDVKEQPWLINNKRTQRVQTPDKAAHYPHIAWIPNLESQHGDADHLKNLIKSNYLFLLPPLTPP